MASTSAAEPSPAMKESRNWLEVPEELMVDIFKRLTTVEVLNSARKVCTTWGRICENPAMWKIIKMLRRLDDGGGSDCDLVALTKEAVDLSCGELIDISIEYFGTNELIDHIVLKSNKLKRLCLVSCSKINYSALSLALKRLPQLEELHLIDALITVDDLEDIGGNCPQLKSLKMSTGLRRGEDVYALAIVDSMPELRHLALLDDQLTNEGLEAIINGCPHLESLDVRMCDKLDLDEDLVEFCKEEIKDFKYGSQSCGFYDMKDSSEGEMCDFSSDSSVSDFGEDWNWISEDDLFQDWISEGDF